MWRSVPQMPQAPTLTTTWRSPGFGLGTSATLTEPGWSMIAARQPPHPFLMLKRASLRPKQLVTCLSIEDFSHVLRQPFVQISRYSAHMSARRPAIGPADMVLLV